MLIDTHCHINDREAFPNPAEAIRRAVEAGVGQIVVVGVDEASMQAALELCDGFENVFAILGWHPNYTADYSLRDIERLSGLLKHPKVLALGEIGLDFHWNYSPFDKQLSALITQLDLAAELELPVVFHCREAYDTMLTCIEERTLRPYLFHCWMGNADQIERAVDLDCYFGVDGPITYKKNSALRDVIMSLPRDRVVIETDSPYLSPEPLRGKPNEPANVRLVAARLAELWDCSTEEAGRITTENAQRFFTRLGGSA